MGYFTKITVPIQYRHTWTEETTYVLSRFIWFEGWEVVGDCSGIAEAWRQPYPATSDSGSGSGLPPWVGCCQYGVSSGPGGDWYCLHEKRRCYTVSIDMAATLADLKQELINQAYTPSDYRICTSRFDVGSVKDFYEKFDEIQLGEAESIKPIMDVFTIVEEEFIDGNSSVDIFTRNIWAGEVGTGPVIENTHIDLMTAQSKATTGYYNATWNDCHMIDRSEFPTSIEFWLYKPDPTYELSDLRVTHEDDEPVPGTEDEEIEQDETTGDGDWDSSSSPSGGRTTENTSGYNPETEWSEVQDFDNIYLPADVPIETIPGMVIGEDTYYYDLTGVYVESIKNSLVESDMMIFVEPVKYDEAGKYRVGERVLGVIYGQTKFLGYVQSKERVFRDNEQYIRYTATGARSRLYDLGFAFEFKFTNITIKAAFRFICSKIPSVIVNSYDASALPTTVIPELDLGTCTYGKALDSLLDMSGHYGFYIDHTKKLTVYNLESLTQNNVRIPSEGEAVGTHKVISKDISMDVSQCKTRCVIQGDYPVVEIEEQVGYTRSGNEYYLQLHPGIVKYLLSDSSKDIIIKSHIGTNSSLAPIHIDCVSGKVKCVLVNGYSSDIRNISSSVYVRYCYKESSPLKVDTGWIGTAYTQYQVQNTKVKRETRFKKQSGAGVTSRDDTEKMRLYANQLIAPIKDAKYGGSVSMDMLLVDFGIGQCVNFTNTGEDWSGIKLVVYSITYQISDLKTDLELSNVYYIGSGVINPRLEEKQEDRADITDLEQLKRIILDLEKRV